MLRLHLAQAARGAAACGLVLVCKQGLDISETPVWFRELGLSTWPFPLLRGVEVDSIWGDWLGCHALYLFFCVL